MEGVYHIQNFSTIFLFKTVCILQRLLQGSKLNACFFTLPPHPTYTSFYSSVLFVLVLLFKVLVPLGIRLTLFYISHSTENMQIWYKTYWKLFQEAAGGQAGFLNIVRCLCPCLKSNPLWLQSSFSFTTCKLQKFPSQCTSLLGHPRALHISDFSGLCTVTFISKCFHAPVGN